MLCCIADIVAFVFGIVALIKGEFSLSGNKVVRSGPARIIGVLLLLPLILGMGGEMVYGAIKGFELAQQGKQMDMAAFQRENQIPALVIHGIGAGLPFLAALIVALVSAGPKEEKRRREWDDDDRPRRRLSDDEPEDDLDIRR